MATTEYTEFHRPIAPGDPTPRPPDEPGPSPGPDPGPGDPQLVRNQQWPNPNDTVDALLRQYQMR